MKNKKFIALIIVLIAVVAGVYVAIDKGIIPPNIPKPQAEAASKPAEVKTIAAEPVAAGIGALGRIEPRSRVLTVSHDAGPEGARIGSLLVTEGQAIKAGDVIAYFSNNSRKTAELNAAKSNTEALKAKLKALEAEAEIGGREFERNRKLLKSQAVSESRTDEAELRLRQAKANVTALKADITAAEANLVLAEEEVKQTILTAPISGTIIKIHSYPGERVNDSGVVQMADLSQMDVVAEVYERDISKLVVGQTAEIKIPGKDEAIIGKVREIGFQVRKNDINDTDPLADKDNRTVEVRISIDENKATELQHLIYMQVNVRIDL